MKNLIFLSILLLAFYSFTYNFKGNSSNLKTNSGDINIYDINVKMIDGADKSLSDYKGNVLLIVNVASYCGNTPQYDGLEKLYNKYKAQGFEILAFPCNDFGKQEPGTNEEIKTFCTTKYNVTFQLFDKIKVLGDDKNPLYAKLTKYDPAGDIKWNFEKFIIDKNGNVAGRFTPKTQPDNEELTALIEREIAK